MNFTRYCLVGGAGFIGSHFVDALLQDPTIEKVTIYDNFSSGKAWHYEHHQGDSRLSVVRGDVKDSDTLEKTMEGHDAVMHFASNPDIARAVKEPSIDFTEGIYLTHQVLEAIRKTRVKRLIFTSGSGVYGEVNIKSPEDQAGMYPISPYGASKLGSEAFICSYCHMFDLSACVVRLANVVGPRQTHGVGYDFIRRLRVDSTKLHILGDGMQTKSYIHVQDVVSAVLLLNSTLSKPFDVYNVATHDTISVLDIAHVILECMNIPMNVPFYFSGGDRGFKGDVPVVRLNTAKIASLGWRCQLTSREAIRESALAMINSPISEA